MAVTIEIKENSKQAKQFLEYAKTLSFVKFKKGAKTKNVSSNKGLAPNKETSEIIKENRTKRGTKAKNALDMFEKMGVDV